MFQGDFCGVLEAKRTDMEDLGRLGTDLSLCHAWKEVGRRTRIVEVPLGREDLLEPAAKLRLPRSSAQSVFQELQDGLRLELNGERI